MGPPPKKRLALITPVLETGVPIAVCPKAIQGVEVVVEVGVDVAVGVQVKVSLGVEEEVGVKVGEPVGVLVFVAVGVKVIVGLDDGVLVMVGGIGVAVEPAEEIGLFLLPQAVIKAIIGTKRMTEKTRNFLPMFQPSISSR